jgi:polysaccharide pyruvyl transferase WcaK-like protein
MKYLSADIASKMYKFSSIPFPDTILRKYIKEIKHVDMIIYSGMGTMNDHYPFQGIIGRAMVTAIAKTFNKPIIFSGQGIGPLDNKINITISKKIVRHIKMIFVRDRTGSKKTLKKIGYPQKNIVECNDDAYYLSVDKKDRVASLKLLKSLKLEKEKFIVINLHNWNKSMIEKIFKSLINVIKLSDSDNKILLLPNYYTGKLDDRKALKEFQRYIKKHNPELSKNCVYTDKVITASMSKAIIGYAYMTIATRYHPGVFSLAEGKPCILLSTDDVYYVQKMSGALEWYGLEKYYIHYKNISKLPSVFKSLQKNRKNIIKIINKKNILFTKDNFRSFQYIIKILG